MFLCYYGKMALNLGLINYKSHMLIESREVLTKTCISNCKSVSNPDEEDTTTAKSFYGSSWPRDRKYSCTIFQQSNSISKSTIRIVVSCILPPLRNTKWRSGKMTNKVCILSHLHRSSGKQQKNDSSLNGEITDNILCA